MRGSHRKLTYFIKINEIRHITAENAGKDSVPLAVVASMQVEYLSRLCLAWAEVPFSLIHQSLAKTIYLPYQKPEHPMKQGKPCKRTKPKTPCSANPITFVKKYLSVSTLTSLLPMRYGDDMIEVKWTECRMEALNCNQHADRTRKKRIITEQI